ncbi:hypothetical protein ALC62_04317 [Cyphomyrmex costatus]|uniref:Uncharacterized protein n=1 Tax=Cyphomyrmex costatus TaxID=456900 RepID=A0A195CWM0_9HYME|nr:hypothetical protein ALC62_04317 [Cyphomyrmex costatus]
MKKVVIALIISVDHGPANKKDERMSSMSGLYTIKNISNNTYSKDIKTVISYIVSGWKKCCKCQHFYELCEYVNTTGLIAFPEGTILRSEKIFFHMYPLKRDIYHLYCINIKLVKFSPVFCLSRRWKRLREGRSGPTGRAVRFSDCLRAAGTTKPAGPKNVNGKRRICLIEDGV